MTSKAARGIASELKLEYGMFECDIAAYEGVLRQAANFPDCLPALLLMGVGLRAATIEDLEREALFALFAELAEAEVRPITPEDVLLWRQGLPEDSSEYEAAVKKIEE